MARHHATEGCARACVCASAGHTARVFFELTTLNADKGLISDEELARPRGWPLPPDH